MPCYITKFIEFDLDWNLLLMVSTAKLQGGYMTLYQPVIHYVILGSTILSLNISFLFIKYFIYNAKN